MSFSNRTDALMRHRRLVSLLAGFLLNPVGNWLYGTSHRTVGLVLWVMGLVFVLLGRRSVSDLTDWPITKRVRGWGENLVLRVTNWRITKRVRGWGEKWKDHRNILNVVAWSLVVIMVILYAVGLTDRIGRKPDQVAQHFFYGQAMMYIWLFLPLWGHSTESKDLSAVELDIRISRAVINRMVANAAGIYFLGVLIYAYVFPHRPPLLVPVVVTLGGAMIATGHRTWTRVRKLSTQLHGNIQTLKRDLEMISSSKEKPEKQDAARRSWDAVQLNLWTSVDTGYTFGTSFLPRETTNDLCERVERAIQALPEDKDAAAEVLAALGKILEACGDRIDSVA
jgi:hypothetical protein